MAGAGRKAGPLTNSSACCLRDAALGRIGGGPGFGGNGNVHFPHYEADFFAHERGCGHALVDASTAILLRRSASRNSEHGPSYRRLLKDVVRQIRTVQVLSRRSLQTCGERKGKKKRTVCSFPIDPTRSSANQSKPRRRIGKEGTHVLASISES